MIKTQIEVIILGMHRSGTSMVGGVLCILGVNMGIDSPGIQYSNPLGHFEDGGFLALNNSILAEAGGTWDKPPSRSALGQLKESFMDDVQQLIGLRRQAAHGGIWGWKEPRTSLTADFYLPYLNNPHIIWCNRDPGEIAASLWKRNKIQEKDAYQLIDRYQESIRELIDSTPQVPVLILEYGELISDPKLWVDRISGFLHLEPGQDQVINAINFMLPRKQVKKEKIKFRLKYLRSLPGKAVKKYIVRRKG